MRIEQDLLGELAVPAEALYGIHTQRALQNFPVKGSRTVGDYPDLIEGFVLTKKAAAQANGWGGFLTRPQVEAITAACDWVVTERPWANFPVHALHGGGGTSINMNVNEVLANYAEEWLGGQRGQYRLIHPNEHINLHQSTSDVYLTAGHIAIIRRWSQAEPDFWRLLDTVRLKSQQWPGQKRLARTCLQDAVDITFADFFGGYAGFVERANNRLAEAVDRLHTVNLGGTIVGRRGDVPEIYFERVMEALRQTTGDAAYTRAANLFDAAQNVDDLVAVSGALNIMAGGLVKMAQDLRLLASGPQAGLAEIRLPAVQAGSSMMPGKINPVIPEFVIQLCLQAGGAYTVCQAALSHGELDLNIWGGLIIINILAQIELLAEAVAAFESKCLRGLDIDPARNTQHAETLFATLSRLMKTHGYTQINDICKLANGDIDQLTRLLQERELI